MLSRPLVLGGLLGWAGGDPGTGFMLGALIELLLLQDLPVGGALPLNGAVAATVAVAAASGPWPLDPAWNLPLSLLAARAFRPLEERLRQGRSELVARAERAVEEGREPRYGRLIAAGLLREFALALAFTAAATAALKGLGGWWWGWEPMRKGAELAWKAAPALALTAAVWGLKPQVRPRAARAAAR
jgi:mannose/fructose/N-acetylgalactosamine-specific phosphotransferase system component IIC